MGKKLMRDQNADRPIVRIIAIALVLGALIIMFQLTRFQNQLDYRLERIEGQIEGIKSLIGQKK